MAKSPHPEGQQPHITAAESSLGERVLVTGATGFIGTPVVDELLARGAQVTALCRDPARGAAWAQARPERGGLTLLAADIAELTDHQLGGLASHDRILHLAWGCLDAFKSEAHVTEVLPRHSEFLRQLVARGAKHLLVAGTCLEYGLQEGCLDERLEPRPVTAYGRAKDALRRTLEPLCAAHGVVFQWCRLFYMHGVGQAEKSLLSQLDRAIKAGADSFDMSGGEQERDYLPVAEVAGLLVRVASQDRVAGVINCASGRPVTVRALVDEHLARRGASLRLNLGHYPYPDYEPMRFWADTKKLVAALAAGDTQNISRTGAPRG
jgi:nucleoside-diphosphate-sugar epimerase